MLLSEDCASVAMAIRGEEWFPDAATIHLLMPSAQDVSQVGRVCKQANLQSTLVLTAICHVDTWLFQLHQFQLLLWFARLVNSV